MAVLIRFTLSKSDPLSVLGTGWQKSDWSLHIMSAKILYKYFNKNSILLLQRRYISTTSRINAKWYPDTEFMRTFDGPVMYPDHITSKLKPPLWSNNIRPKEMKIHNMTINFGPAHPAAHGVMRLILLLDGEVTDENNTV